MKIKNIILISLLLVILTMSAVGAAEDANQTLSADDVLASDEPLGEDVNITVYEQDTILKDQEDYFYVELRSQRLPDGNLTVTIDEKEAYNEPAYVGDTEIPYSIVSKALGNDFGVHDITFALCNDSHLKDVSQSWKINYTYYMYNLPYELSEPYIDMNFANGVAGTVTLTVDNKKIDSQTIEDGCVGFYMEDLKYGEHNYKIEFKSSKNTNVFKSFTHTGKFNYDYFFEVSFLNDEIYYGEYAGLEINLPWNVKNDVIVSYNGKNRTVKVDSEGCIYLEINDLQLGANEVTVSYPKDSNYHAKSKTVTVYVKEVLNVTEDVRYLSGEGILLKLPENAIGNLSVIVDGSENIYPLANGTTTVDLSGYHMGTHTIKVNYTGDDYTIEGFDGTFDVVANFIYPKNVYYNDGVNLGISLPGDANGTLTVSYDDRYRKANVINGSASVLFEDIPAYEGLEFLMQYSNGNYAGYEKTVCINSREDPDNVELIIKVPQTVLSNGYDDFTVFIGSYSEGYVNISIDGKYCRNASVYDNVVWIKVYELVKDLKVGNHTITIAYSGDDYYIPKSNTTSFNVDFYALYPEDKVITNEYSSLSMNVNRDVTGTATLYIAGKTIKGTYDEWYYNDDYENKYMTFDLSSIPCGEYDAKLVFAGDKKYAKFTKEFKLTITYMAMFDDFSLGDEHYNENYYGENTTMHFVVSAGIQKVNVTVGNQTYTCDVKDNEVSLDVKNTVVGEQNVTLTCFATGKYPQKTFNWKYYVSPKINIPEKVNIIDGGNVNLTLPNDAKGNLEVSIYDKGILVGNYTSKMENGTADVKFNLTKLGNYEIIARYTGDDYNVKQVNGKVTLTPKITYPNRIYIGQDANLTFEMPSDANGDLCLAFAASRLDVTYKDGKAVVAIPHYDAIEDDVYYLYVLYEDPVYGTFHDDCFDYLDVMKYSANITPALPKEIIANNYITVTLTLPSDATGYIYYYDGSAEIVDGKATFKAFVENAGENSIWYTYSGDEKYAEEDHWIDVTALPAPKLTMSAVTVYYTKTATMKVKVVDSYGKIVKGKYVAFYVNGKKVKSVKTDNKGYATLKLSKTPGTYNVKVTYKGGVVTKKLTVKHLVTLKTVKVKKSARRLVLTATLKKGKTPLKYKRVTFKFNGKTYKVKTNKKGVAKITIKRTVLKKLKVGKTVTYQATYLKDTVKKTAKVIK